MFSKLFNWRKRGNEEYPQLPVPETANWGFLGTDMHSHFLPGIDDGAKTLSDSMTLLRAMVDMGYKSVITTPHVMIDYYPNTTETIQNALRQVQEAIKEEGLAINIKAAAEYYIDDYFIRLIDKEPLLTIHANEVLVEFSMLYEPPMLFDVIFKLQAAGYKPIIAHPERYNSMHQEFAKYRQLKDKGCLLQLNMLSISGYYGKNVKQVADDLLIKGMYDYCGSDMHHERHAGALRALATSKDFHSIMGYPFLNSRLVL